MDVFLFQKNLKLSPPQLENFTTQPVMSLNQLQEAGFSGLSDLEIAIRNKAPQGKIIFFFLRW